MFRPIPLLAAALMMVAPVPAAADSALPGALEMQPGVFILKGGANPAIYPALKRQRITHVIDLRKDSEITPESAFSFTTLQEMKVHYMRYATSRVPPAVDLDFIRTLLKDLPKEARIVVTCNNGNRAAAAVCPWLVLDKGMPMAEVLMASRRAGLDVPETEDAIRAYLQARM